MPTNNTKRTTSKRKPGLFSAESLLTIPEPNPFIAANPPLLDQPQVVKDHDVLPTQLFNITYERAGKRLTYLTKDVSLAEARHWLAYFKARYIDKPMPNGKARYPITNARIVEA
jgi:hypothetical protein